MPRNKQTNEFEAGGLRTITHNGEKYYVDGRLKECRNVDDFMNHLDVDAEEIFDQLSKEDQSTVVGEYYGYSEPTVDEFIDTMLNK